MFIHIGPMRITKVNRTAPNVTGVIIIRSTAVRNDSSRFTIAPDSDRTNDLATVCGFILAENDRGNNHGTANGSRGLALRMVPRATVTKKGKAAPLRLPTHAPAGCVL